MRFARLRLTGFKSFVDPTELRIEDGLTGVVGPNGCGKSNLLEALRWVMGEASPRSLRGAGMEDVIFAGTALRPARSFADVSLLIDNRERRAPAQFNAADELEISRRIERDLGSAYRVNGKDVRQKDVQLLFADAASGAHSPALVSQGRIGAIINAKPADRRAILEEAAGIAGLHSRRKEAEQRLRAAEANLARLDDLMAQLELQVTALRRQSRQAERYKLLSADIRLSEAMLLYRRWAQAAKAMTGAQQALKAVGDTLAEATGEAARLGAAQAERAARLPDLRQAEAEAAAAWQRIRLALEQLGQEEQRLGQRQEELKRQLDTIGRDRTREAQLASDAAAALERLAQEQAATRTRLASAQNQKDSAQARVAAAEAAASQGERAFDTLTQANADALAQKRALMAQVEAARARLTRLEEDRKRLTDERERLEKDERGAEADSARARLAEALDARAGAEERIASAEQARAQAEAARSQAVTADQGAAARISALAAEQAGLERLLARPSAGKGGAPVLDALKVSPGFEKALGAALADDLDAPVGGDGARRWSADALGANADPALPAGADALIDHVDAPAALTRRLRQIGVVDGAPTPEQIAALAPGQRLVDRQGGLWRWDGFIARAGAGPQAAERLTQRNRLDQLTQELLAARQAGDGARAALASASEALAKAQADEQGARAQRREAEQAEAQARGILGRLEQALRQREARLAGLKESQARLEDDRRVREQERSQAEQLIADLPDMEKLSLKLTDQRRIVERLRADLANARGQLEALVRQISADEARQRSISTDIAAWEHRIEAGASQRDELAERESAAAAELDRLATRPAVLAQERNRLADQLAQGDALRAQAADRLALVEAELRTLDAQSRAVTEQLAQAREQRARLDAQVEALSARRQELAMTIGEQFQCPPPLLLGKLGIDETAGLPEIDALESKLERLRAERERLGAVNLRADIELAEIEETLGTNAAEKAELVEAIHKLRGSIGSLNREGRQRLLDAFDIVNGHFKELFSTLFGGGEAYLALTETDDPLDAGLEIMASPPGKKLQHLGLLSGGEQALTAVALIFAVFLTNPAPVCVLDEVDAPLDDANVERFCDLLAEMTRRADTRFLIVTHNAVTMSRMDRLFGVTMSERGVSQLVSVDLGRAEQLLAAE